MSVEAKVTFMHSLEQRLSSVLTVDNMKQVMGEVADQLCDYEMEIHNYDENATDDLLDAYVAALKVQGRSPKTVVRYQYIIQRVMKAIRTNTRNVTVYHLRKYMADELARGISERTVDGVRQVCSGYFGWLQRERLIEINPCANLGAVKYPDKPKDVFDEVEMDRLKFGCKSLRDRAIVCFLQATGCRISEMCELNRDDIEMDALECVVHGKGNKYRTVFLTQVAAATLQSYLDSRTDDLPALFVGRGSERLTPGGIRKMLVELGKTANVGHVHPHKFRRTTATTLIRHGMPIQEVAAILGHDKLDTTMEYVVLDKSDIKHSYRKYA